MLTGKFCFSFSINHVTDYILETTDMPDELIRDVSGQVLFEQTLPYVSLLTFSYPIHPTLCSGDGVSASSSETETLSSETETRPRPDHSRPRPPLPRPRPNIFLVKVFLHEKHHFFHWGNWNLPPTECFFHASICL